MSPLNTQPHNKIEEAAPEQRIPHFQEHWYKFISNMVNGMSVLDVGAGSGYGIDILKAGGAEHVHAIDIAPLSPLVEKQSIEQFQRSSFDAVLAIDVIEHVEDDREFLSRLLRVCKNFVFLTTPNWNVSKCSNEFHVREYTPVELQALLGSFNALAWDAWSSDAHCKIKPIEAFHEADNNFGILIYAHL